MPFREKVRRALGRLSVSEEGADLTRIASKASKKEKKQRTPSNVYKPGEAMPKPKYGGPVNQEHQDKLHAFEFASAFRRRNSEQSQYSPMGSRLPSRRNSLLGLVGFGSRSRKQSVVDPVVKESTEGDDDVKNVGLSRQQTRDDQQRWQTPDSQTKDPLQQVETVTDDHKNGHVDGTAYGIPFSEDDLARALTKTTLKPSESEKAWLDVPQGPTLQDEMHR